MRLAGVDFDANFQVIQGTANAVYKFANSPESKLRPYLIGGVGLYNSKLTGDDVPDNTDGSTDFGLNAGAGFDFQAGAAALFVEGRFHKVFADGDIDPSFIPITVGIRLGGS